MSGLQGYYNTVNSFSSNLETAQSFLDNYDSKFYQDFNDKVADIKEQGKGLLEAGATLEGIYAGGKAVQGSVKAFRSKFTKKNDSDEDGKEGDDDEGADEGVDDAVDDVADDAGDMFSTSSFSAPETAVESVGDDVVEDASSSARQLLGGFQGESGSGGSVGMTELSDTVARNCTRNCCPKHYIINSTRTF